MKKIIFICSIICLAGSWTGCDDLLNVTPETDLTDDDFWKTEVDLKGACNRLYQLYPTTGLHDSRADDWVRETGADNVSAGSRAIPAESSDWTAPYSRIFVANNIIEKGANAPVSENIRNRYVGEACFFRAWYFFELVSKYGDVPLVLKPFTSTSDPDLKMGRTPRETVIQQCYDDLEFAAEWLPTRANMQSVTDEFERRRVTRSAALALTVRIGLHEGTMLKFHDLGAETLWKAHLQKSIDAYNRLKAEGHQLYTTGGASVSYQASFLDENNNTNRETIFAKAFGPNGTFGGTSVLNQFSISCNDAVGVTRSMIDLYLYADGLPREKSSLVVNPETSFNNVFGYDTDGVTPLAGGMGARDPRLPMSFWRINDPQDTPTAQVAGIIIGWSSAQPVPYETFQPLRSYGYHLKKSVAGSLFLPGDRDYIDRFGIRWSEMLISYAEAFYEINGSITDALLDETVNALRGRVGFNAKLTNAFVSANGLDMREEIHRERTVEMMCEDRRYADIIRWKIAERVLPKAMLGAKFTAHEATNGLVLAADPTFTSWLTDADGKLDGVQEYDYPEADVRVIEKSNTRRFNPARDYFYPIPTFEIAQSEGNIKQNPGWE
ncbi:MAG: RagB/SusD family nutrient uptake outer membrane protein [Tannerella sp.]|jgi:hypothetical protein|nr:RagB/SusD family nutrient uptake outer membrane protein [Tannerella sp.]